MVFAGYINRDTKASEVVNTYPLTLLMLEYFSIPLGFNDKTVGELANDFNIDVDIFLSIIQLYQGQNPGNQIEATIQNALTVVNFLRNSHHHYKHNHFPVLTHYLSEISKVNTHDEINLLMQFFDDYLDEVTEHLQYEDNVVFPYITGLQQIKTGQADSEKFSIDEYREHHNDIEEKLNDLRNLLIRHLPAQNDSLPRRKLLFALNELEADLHVHGLVEELVLIPIVERLEESIKSEK